MCLKLVLLSKLDGGQACAFTCVLYDYSRAIVAIILFTDEM